MLSFGSRNFGQANFGYGIRQVSVDEIATTSTMQVAGYRFFNTSTLHSKGITNVDIASGLLQGAFIDITATATVIVSGIKMEWHPQMTTPQSTATVYIAGKLAWDSQLVDDTTWTDQTVS